MPPSSIPVGQSANRSIARSAGYLLLAKVTSRALRVVYMVVLARFFGPESFALFTYALFWQVLFMSVAIFGTGRILSRQIGSDRDHAEHYIAVNIALRSLTSVVAAVGCGLLALSAGSDLLSRQILLIFALTIPARSVVSWTQRLFIAYEVPHFFLRQELLFRSLEVVLGLIVLALGGGLLAVAAVHALSWGLQAISGWRIVRIRLVPIAFDWRANGLIQLAWTGVAFMLVSFFSSAMIQGSLLLYNNVSPSQTDLGQLAMVFQVLGVSLLAPRSITTAALPVISRLVAEGAGGERRSITLMLRISMLGAAGLALLGLVVAPTVISFVAGEAYRPAAESIGPALWLLIPLSIGSLMNQLIIAHGRYWWTAACAGLGALVMAAAISLSIGGPNMATALLATGLGASVWALSDIALVTRQGWLPMGAFGRAGLAVTVAALMFWLLSGFSAWLALLASWLMLVPGLVPPRVLVRRLLGRLAVRSDR